MRFSLVPALASILTVPIAAQSPIAPLPPKETPAPSGVGPALTYLMNEFGISEADARERLQAQAEVIELSRQLNKEADPAFAHIYTEHAPAFKVIVAFADTKDRQALLDSLSPKLRRYVQLKVVPKSRGQVESNLDELASIFRASGMPFGGGFNPKSGRFRIEVETQQNASRARDLIPPHLRDEVGVEVKPLPKPETAPTGVVSGDWIAGG